MFGDHKLIHLVERHLMLLCKVLTLLLDWNCQDALYTCLLQMFISLLMRAVICG